MPFDVRHPETGVVLYHSAQAETAGEAIAEAIATGRSRFLRGADPRDADARSERLIRFRDDIWTVLSSSPAEVPAVLQALRKGRIEGSVYSGECACLVGTLAKARRCNYDKIPGLVPYPFRDAERFFTNIHAGDTPKNSVFAKLAYDWISTWLKPTQSAFTTDTKRVPAKRSAGKRASVKLTKRTAKRTVQTNRAK
jgi:hypothetical protein